MSPFCLDDTLTLHLLSVYSNNLTTLDSRLFVNIRRPLGLFLSDNPFDCESFCWLKQEESLGTIQFQLEGYSKEFQPECRVDSWESMECSQGIFSICVNLFWAPTLLELGLFCCAALTCSCSKERLHPHRQNFCDSEVLSILGSKMKFYQVNKSSKMPTPSIKLLSLCKDIPIKQGFHCNILFTCRKLFVVTNFIMLFGVSIQTSFLEIAFVNLVACWIVSIGLVWK